MRRHWKRHWREYVAVALVLLGGSLTGFTGGFIAGAGAFWLLNLWVVY